MPMSSSRPMRYPLKHSERAVVLVLTILVLSLLVMMGFSFSYSAGVNLATARNAREAAAREAAQQSALNYALAVLEKDARDSQIDTLNETWAKETAIEVGGFAFTVRIVDENRRLNMNRAVRPPLDPEKDYDLREALNRLILGSGGDESDCREFYDAFASTQIIFIEDILGAKGLSPRLFDVDANKPALNSLLSTHPLQVNVNTAMPSVIEALCPDTAMGRALLQRREERSFRDDAEIEAFLMTLTNEQAARRLAGVLSVSSDFFTVTVAPAAGGEGLTALARRSGETALPLFVRRLD